ncbi:MAG: response regulator [Alkalispirochaetaceae bacterium]
MARTNKKERTFSALEVANICGVVNQTAINWIKDGHLKAFRTPGRQYRVYAEELARFLHSRGMKMPEELQKVLADQVAIENVLIVDDDRDLNDLIKQFLEKRFPDYSVSQAFDGFEAGKSLAEAKPDIVLLDIDLPGVDGNKLCRSIKEDEGLAAPIVVAISGLDDPNVQERIMGEGADAFLAKPLDLEKLPQLFDELAEKRKRPV